MRNYLGRPVAIALCGLALSVAGLADGYAAPRTVAEFRAGGLVNVRINERSRQEAHPLVQPFVNAVHRFVLDKPGGQLTWEIRSESGERLVLFKAPIDILDSDGSFFVGNTATNSGPVAGEIVCFFRYNPAFDDVGLNPFFLFTAVRSGDVLVEFRQRPTRTFPSAANSRAPF